MYCVLACILYTILLTYVCAQALASLDYKCGYMISVSLLSPHLRQDVLDPSDQKELERMRASLMHIKDMKDNDEFAREFADKFRKPKAKANAKGKAKGKAKAKAKAGPAKKGTSQLLLV